MLAIAMFSIICHFNNTNQVHYTIHIKEVTNKRYIKLITGKLIIILRTST